MKDLQGKVDIANEKNYVSVNGDGDAIDDNGHGTHVAGVIATTMNNDYGIQGIHQSAQILLIKVLNASGEGETDAIALGIKYAVDQGAKVINMSLGGGESLDDGVYDEICGGSRCYGRCRFRKRLRHDGRLPSELGICDFCWSDEPSRNGR
ncbi:S8 family serine peptidase [Exiguobacterium sp. SL14]|nr:S8 family serine peptidase [Exiguobacterium sp. SL14]MCY1692373.1 S8 family serine peptidase [Exiguobacterium sp. SL14]